jgi:hypothetical protein
VEIRSWEHFYVETMARIISMAESRTPPYPIAWAVEVMAILSALVHSAEIGGETVRLNEL